MDDQRLEEIAKRAAVATLDSLFHLPATTAHFRSNLEEAAYRAAKEALSSQEEALRKVREERDTLLHVKATTAHARDLNQTRAREAEARAESAEAELLRLRDQAHQLEETVSVQAYEITQHVFRERRTSRLYRCHACGWETNEDAETHEPMLCSRTNCGGRSEAIAD